MASSERLMPVPPEVVWDTLADPAGYAEWVVGSKHVRDADAAWRGTRVEMDERPRGLLARLLVGNRLADGLLARRNDRALARLESLARRRAAA